MEEAAELISAVGVLMGAIAWPALSVFLAVFFRTDIREAISGIPSFLDRLRKMKVAGIEAELDNLADKADGKGAVTADQTRVAASLLLEADELGEANILRELDKLCLQYDTVRRSMAAGRMRTHEMTRILVKMRAIGPSAVRHIETYKGSGSAGSRLAAIAMMQMSPSTADVTWLLGRFRTEKPFLLYHAALALTNVANERNAEERSEIVLVAKDALEIMRSFGGEPDKNTVDVLEALICE